MKALRSFIQGIPIGYANAEKEKIHPRVKNTATVLRIFAKTLVYAAAVKILFFM